MKAPAKYRNKIYKYTVDPETGETWYFYIDKIGDCHTSFEESFVVGGAHMNKGVDNNHNHWFSDEFFKELVPVKTKPIQMENK